MEEIVTMFLLLGVLFILGIFAFYLLRHYLFPKRVGELEEMLKLGHVQPAIKKLQKLIEENPRDPYIHALLAQAYELSKDKLSAVMEYKQALKYLEMGVTSKNIKEETVRRRVGKLYLRLKNNEEAKKEFLILTKLEPGNADNFYQVGLLFQKSGLLNKALPYFQNAITIDPSHAQAQYQLGQLQYHLGTISDAKASLLQAVRLETGNYPAHYYLGLCYKSLKEYDAAMKELNVAVRDENFRPQTYLARGQCFLESENFAKAQVEFSYALESATPNSEIELNAHYCLGIINEKARDFYSAISHWERIMEVNPKYRDVSSKLRIYKDFRTDDSVKDFLIAPNGKFEKLCLKVVQKMNLEVSESHLESDSEMRLVCNESDSTNMRAKRNTCIVYIFRSLDPVPEKSLRQLYDNMRAFSCNRGICITTGSFTTQATTFAQTYNIDLRAAKESIKLLREVM